MWIHSPKSSDKRKGNQLTVIHLAKVCEFLLVDDLHGLVWVFNILMFLIGFLNI